MRFRQLIETSCPRKTLEHNKNLDKSLPLYIYLLVVSVFFFDDPLQWELHLLSSHEFDYLHLINLLLQNQYYMFPIIQKSFLNSGSFQSFYHLLITPFTKWRIFHFFNSIASFVLFSFFPFLFSFLLPSFFFPSFCCCFSFVEVDKISEKCKNELLFYIILYCARTSNE